MTRTQAANSLIVFGCCLPGLAAVLLASRVPAGGLPLTGGVLVGTCLVLGTAISSSAAGIVLSARSLYRDPGLRTGWNVYCLGTGLVVGCMLAVILATIVTKASSL